MQKYTELSIEDRAVIQVSLSIGACRSGIWLCARRLNKGKFHWGETWRGKQLPLDDEQLTALVQGLPWQRLGAAAIISVYNHKLMVQTIINMANRHKAYVWAYCTTPFSDLKAVVYNFAPTRTGGHARNFLGGRQDKLVCDDYSGYKAGFGNGITEIGCMVHARRKFYDLHQANQSTLAA